MGYIVREADIQTEKDQLVRILTENRTRQDFDYEKRFDWIYLDNPNGKAIAWVIVDEKSNTPAGFTAVFPWKILVNGKEHLAWNCGDFSIYKEYRTLGIALKLRKAAKAGIDEGKVPFLFANPNERMEVVHLKVGHIRSATLNRYAMPLRLTKYLENKSYGKIGAKLANPLYTSFLKFKHRQNGEYENLSQAEMNFDDSYREICESLNKVSPVIGLRDSTHLTWKYKNHPNAPYQLFNYYRKGRLEGYVVYGVKDDSIYLNEFLSKPGDGIPASVLGSFIRFVISHYPDVQSLTTIIQEFNPFLPVLEQAGFRKRKDSSHAAIVYAADPQLQSIVHDGRNWFMNVGDRDQ